MRGEEVISVGVRGFFIYGEHNRSRSFKTIDKSRVSIINKKGGGNRQITFINEFNVSEKEDKNDNNDNNNDDNNKEDNNNNDN